MNWAIVITAVSCISNFWKIFYFLFGNLLNYKKSEEAPILYNKKKRRHIAYSLLWYSTINTSCKNGKSKSNQRDVNNWYIIKKLYQKLLMLYREIIYIYILIASFSVTAVHSSDVCSLDILI